jgi:hypothetical protein
MYFKDRVSGHQNSSGLVFGRQRVIPWLTAFAIRLTHLVVIDRQLEDARSFHSICLFLSIKDVP